MGFGYGGSQAKSGIKRYNNTQTAHVWNAQRERAGQSNNGNFYFEGRAIYSYGSHFVCGYIMPDGLALLNADSYSVSTSGHQSDTRRAVSDRRTVTVADLTELAGNFKPVDRLARWIADGKPAGDRAAIRKAIKAALIAHASALTASIYAPGESAWRWDSEAGKSVSDPGRYGELGAYLADLAGLPATSWPRAKREAERIAKADKAAKEKAERLAAEKRALQLADMSGRAWRDWIAGVASDYNGAHVLANIRRDLFRSRSLMLKATRGKLAAASRLAIVRERIKSVSRSIDSYESDYTRRTAAKSLRMALARVRACRDASPAGRLATQWATMRDVADAAELLSNAGRLDSLRTSAAELARLARIGMNAIEAENRRQRELEAERAKLAEAERRALWLAGERVGRIYFDAESGGAAMRVIGDTLETSHGASVPLAHAVKAFRFIKLCRERGESFHRNGRTIRVGHFQVDSIDSAGNFRAGCHSFTWPEIERIARQVGVFDCPASADAIEPSGLAA